MTERVTWLLWYTTLFGVLLVVRSADTDYAQAPAAQPDLRCASIPQQLA